MAQPDTSSLIHRDLSGERAQELTAEITRYHRPPGGSGYHAATNLVAEWLRDAGLGRIETTTYPLDGETVLGIGPVSLAWEPHAAEVKIVSPVQEPVVDMESVSSCLAWWSKPTAPGGVTAELVDVGTGESDDDFAGKDLNGKIALIGHTIRPGGWAHAATQAMERGAIGLLSDYLYYEFEPDRTRAGLPEAVQLLRLPNQQGEFDAWACSISYPAAQRLRELLRLGPVRLHADIQCDLFSGHGQNLIATIPGTDLEEESVFFISHTSAATCPCANCAAGPALMVEIARTLNDLIESGDLPRPRRSIKFMFIIEGLGSRAHIDEHREDLDRIKTAFCFDSVGHDQDKLRSVMLWYRHPDSSPSFINDYFTGILERAPQDGTWVFANRQDIGPVQFVQAPYTPWSDNHYWAAYGVPSPLIMSWPDRYFHTQLLTADNTDPRVFRRVGITTALAAYEIANAGDADALTIAREVAARARFRLDDIALQAARSGNEDVGRELRYAAQRDAAAVASTASLMSVGASEQDREQVEAMSQGVLEYAEGIANAASAPNLSSPPPANTQQVLRKLAEGPYAATVGASYPELVGIAGHMAEQDSRIIFDSLRPMGDEFWNLVDGRRTIAEIAEAVCFQFGFELDAEHFLPLVDGMVRSGIAEIVPANGRASR